MTKSKRGANLVAEGLAEAGVKTIFTLSGNQIMPIFDAIIDVGIRLIHVRHEAAAVFMADAWSQLNDEIGVALLPAAPGFANGLAPLYSATCAESSVILISGDSPISKDGMGAFQELDQVAIATPLTKLSKRSVSVETIPDDLSALIKTARSGRPGPVHLALPQDLLEQEVDTSKLSGVSDYSPDREASSDAVVEQIKNELQNAQRPLIITGPALTETRIGELHSKLTSALSVPVVSMESPRGLKDPSLGDFSNVLLESDVVVILGKSVDFTLSFANANSFGADCRVLVVDPDKQMLERARQALGERIVLTEIASVKSLAESLSACQVAPTSDRQRWMDRVTNVITERGEDADDIVSDLIHPASLCTSVQRAMSGIENAILVCDGGEFGQWSQAFLSAPKRIINGISGAIGGGICYAIGAKASHPDSTVFILMGDGTAGFHFSEFETAVRNKLPLVAVIGHDAKWNAEVQLQLREYGEDRLIGCELDETRYDLAVEGLGGHGEYVTDPFDLDAALKRAIDSGLPACVNVRIEGLPAPSGSGH
ncbi:thiamine pyrophosphate-binding protein [Cocleimonas flava]|uniref:Acetolactate synthase-1/2/3 large subunit n=1 Tax=Cocleimonas flava TaxID=634765 RepID=A0A4R1ETJ9_9GAMM|nr:thiamine pyrophosphate-binding protein [Cocleimonas flava]TCJ83124.1 acetolactate synthase-1/2/3 large subunit [Cocleimonas flava]